MTRQQAEVGSEDRLRLILDTATELLAEGGYAALSIRGLAARAGISQGLLYYYFADKHAVFAALMRDHQAALVDLLDNHPRTAGVRALLHAIVPPTRLQWLRVGRVVGVWRAERPGISAKAQERQVAAARAQFEALERALRECAAAQGRRLRPEPEIVPFVWSSLMGIADLHAQGWVTSIDEDRLTDIAITAVVDHILEPEQGAADAHS
ncbi:TetR/AcrR family transcriptional regulator [Nocardia speluncae]|uniref:TetR/AcrR family transcriptional regulator n=1 Tax=Nocardia speluncae TaxID=419477 RepID=A0A846XH40_9NOCA|nr:TetR/AcrR family transcriptional regulator [Nocardia speluncae]NKY33194.1 TetR/AcrR family transcriptional regulator [Nocardia speluncae]